jgi:uncharacterized protein (DUF2236 family)
MPTLSLRQPLALPELLQRHLEASAARLLKPDGHSALDFTTPAGEPALVAADSVSWRIFKNPVTLFIGGVAAVILELADPAVRAGVWEHSSFRSDPMRRLQRTGLAAMITVYGARSKAKAMIAGVRRMHDRVSGQTPSGETYSANDPALLGWVHATAVFGFAEAYNRHVSPLTGDMLDRLYGEGRAAARLYGAVGAPASRAELNALFEAKRPRLEPSRVVFEFLDIMNQARLFPPPLRPAQRVFVRAAVELVPGWVRQRLGLLDGFGLSAWQWPLVRRTGAISDRIVLRSSPAVQSCRRLGLPEDYLYRG